MSLFPSIGGRRTANQQALSEFSESHLMALSQQGNVTHGQLMEQQAAQAAMKEMGEEHSIEMPKVNFYPSTHSNPKKARRQASNPRCSIKCTTKYITCMFKNRMHIA